MDFSLLNQWAGIGTVCLTSSDETTRAGDLQMRHIENAQARREAVRLDQRGEPDLEPDQRFAVDRQQLAITPHVLRPRQKTGALPGEVSPDPGHQIKKSHRQRPWLSHSFKYLVAGSPGV